MLSRSPVARPKKAIRRVAPRVIALEDRLLMTGDPLPIVTGTVSLPIAITRPIPISGIAATPSGPRSIGPNASGPAVYGPYIPSQIRHAYGVDQLGYDGTGQTIAIVDAYDDPTIASDLSAFDARYGLPAAKLVKVNQAGGTTALPAYNQGWSTEISLDVEWAHAIAPGAKILLVEANSAYDSDLLAAVKYAATPSTVTVSPGIQGGGAGQVSMSWGGGEYSGDSSIDSYFQQPGVTYLASAGDSGTEAEYPAVSPYVVGVGGTSISLDAAGDKLSETAWSGSGGAVSAITPRPSYQDGFETSANRGVPDVSYDANPSTGVVIVQNGSFFGVGGTSIGAPQWAGLIALANQGRATAGLSPLGTGKPFGTNSVLYGLAGSGSYTNPNGDFLDVTSGSNGVAAGPGYDNVTGLGSPVANKLIPDLVGQAGASASFVGSDTSTQGSWSSAYGKDGYDVIGGSASLPPYAAVTPSGQLDCTWAATTSDTRALATAPGATSGVAACWYGSSFAVDVNLADGRAHQVSLYLLDWDSTARSERVDVVDPSTGNVLDSRTASGFNGGEYLSWTLTGHVQLRFTSLAGANAVLSGLFFG